MIYSRDIAHLGGTVSNAAKAMENMVDVSVDKVNIFFLNRHHSYVISYNESLYVMIVFNFFTIKV